MNRRNFISTVCGAGAASLAVDLPVLAFQSEKSQLKITSVRIVKTTPKRPSPEYKPAPGSWSTGGVEVANPMSIYPEYKAMRSLSWPMTPLSAGSPSKSERIRV